MSRHSLMYFPTLAVLPVSEVSRALMNALGNLAQIYGAYLFPSADAPKYLMGFGVISGMLGFGVASVVFLLRAFSEKRRARRRVPVIPLPCRKETATERYARSIPDEQIAA